MYAEGSPTVRHGSVRQQIPVILNIYDLGKSDETQALNRFLKCLGTGAFHCGVEVYGREWSFRGSHRSSTGIFCCRPRGCESHTYCESVFMGETALAEHEVQSILRCMESEWIGFNYSLLRQNCCHFCQVFLKHLGVGTTPSWVTSLAEGCAAVEDKVAEWSSPKSINDARQNTVPWHVPRHHSQGRYTSPPVAQIRDPHAPPLLQQARAHAARARTVPEPPPSVEDLNCLWAIRPRGVV